MAIPFILGIVISWLCGIGVLYSLLLLAFALPMMLLGMMPRAAKWIFGVAATLTMISLGMLAQSLEYRNALPRWSGSKGRYEAVLLETPIAGGRAAKAMAMVTRIGRDSIADARREGRVNLYFANVVQLGELRVGEKIFFEGRVETARNAGNPAEFDSERYYYINDITGSVFLPAGSWHRLGVVREFTPMMYAQVLRERIVALYDSAGFRDDNMSVLSALTVGERRDLSTGLKERYAAVGASHILAISGLHLGIIYMVLSFLIPYKGRRRVVLVLRELVVVAVLWVFAAVAGFCPSVVRAAILFTLMSVARSVHRDVSPINSLALAAMLMLLYAPRWLFDVGFQLSFSAVLAILLLSPTFIRLLRAEGKGVVYNYIAGVVSVSVAAQIGTLPFVWYYFGTFPLYFLLTNILVVPAAFLIMLLAVLFVLSSAVGISGTIFYILLDGMLSLVNGVVEYISVLPGVSLELPYIDAVAACAVAVVVATLFYGIVCGCRRSIAVAVVLSGILFSVQFVRLLRDEPPHIVFYNSPACPAVHAVLSPAESYMLSSYPAWEMEYKYVAEPYWRREGMKPPRFMDNVCYSSYRDDAIEYENGLVYFSGRRIKMLCDEHWAADSIITPVDCIVLCRGFLGSIKELYNVYPTRYILMDATLYAGSRRRIRRECAASGIRCIDLTQGAVKMLCEKTGVRFAYFSR